MNSDHERGLDIQAEEGQEKGVVEQIIVRGSKRPRDGMGFTWEPIFGDEYNKHRVTGWGKVSTVSLVEETEIPGPVSPKTGQEASIMQTKLPEPEGGS